MENLLTLSRRHLRTTWTMLHRRRSILGLVLFLSIPCPAQEKENAEQAKARGESEEIERPEVSISGYGLFGNRRLRNTLRLLETGDKPREFLDANYIEDAALILLSQVERDGYLKAEITAELTLSDGSKRTFAWDEAVEEPLPRPISAKEALFSVHEGPLYYYKELVIEGIESLSSDEAKEFFIESGSLLPLKSTRIYTPRRLDRGIASLKEILARKGFQDAQLEASETDRDDQSGAVEVTIRVEEGKKSVVRSVRTEIYFGDAQQPDAVETASPQTPYSQLWSQDFVQELKRTYYRQGYPDTTVTISELRRDPGEEQVEIDFLATVRTGPRITLGDVEFEGIEKTKESVLKRRVRLEEGEPLNRIEAEQGRYRLARLGIFDRIELRYDKSGEARRDVIYGLHEGKRIDVSLLAGYGSYEMLRGGFDLEQYNVFGRAHYSRLRVVQSFKSSRAEYLYTMPEIIGEDVDVFLNASGLRREEVSFTREEFGGGIGARKFYRPLDSDVGLRYSYEVLNAAETDIEFARRIQSAGVASLIADVKHDKRDNPLYPREGYKLFTTAEVASELLGGEVNFQRLEFTGSYHYPISRGRWLHFGLTHGVALTLNGSSQDLPFNKRFFLGGENSVRGYQLGEASPLDEDGRAIGAETFTSANFEFEQALTPAWSVVGFFDAIGIAENLSDYPFREGLFSIGGGIRWKTLIGPIRLEYGYNLNRRKHDPSGTVHLSIGFPF